MIKHCLTLLIFILLYSCKSPSLIKFSNDTQAKEYFISQIESVSIDYHWFSARGRIQMITPEFSGGGRINIRMVKDSLIWFNLKKLSVEGARGQITPDSFCIIYRLEKMYEKGNISELLDYYDLPVSFDELQDYLAGTIPKPQKPSVSYSRQGKNYSLQGHNEKYKLHYTFNEDQELRAFTMTDEYNRTLRIELQNKNEENGIFLGRKMYFPYDENNLGSLEIDLSDVEINVPKNIQFSIPSQYTSY